MGGDAPIFRVSGRGTELLTEVIDLGCRCTGHGDRPLNSRISSPGSIVAYFSDSKRFVFFWHETGVRDGAVLLPAPMTGKQMVPMVEAWLGSVADYGKQPDHDGDNGKGWEVYTDSWGQIDEFGWYSFLAVRPWWEMYGK